MPKHIPDGWHSIAPRLVVPDPAAEVDFLRAAFGDTGEFQDDRPSEMRIGDSMVMITGAGLREAMPALLYLYIEDTDAAYERALATGAESIEAPLDTPYGDRRAIIRDPANITWQIATRLQ
jgi:PhnB protein